ncbi:Tetraspanin-11 [Fragariocoptes setiger]|uniref:Tetraspanin-11 n=1 Tax=Fragariocoptes setiger TaxID=1670756 RepID=A0ABQ7S9L7_9ACAR|nr:Tetraspanin-11 [Fragariocoptes setiger]
MSVSGSRQPDGSGIIAVSPNASIHERLLASGAQPLIGLASPCVSPVSSQSQSQSQLPTTSGAAASSKYTTMIPNRSSYTPESVQRQQQQPLSNTVINGNPNNKSRDTDIRSILKSRTPSIADSDHHHHHHQYQYRYDNGDDNDHHLRHNLLASPAPTAFANSSASYQHDYWFQQQQTEQQRIESSCKSMFLNVSQTPTLDAAVQTGCQYSNVQAQQPRQQHQASRRSPSHPHFAHNQEQLDEHVDQSDIVCDMNLNGPFSGHHNERQSENLPATFVEADNRYHRYRRNHHLDSAADNNNIDTTAETQTIKKHPIDDKESTASVHVYRCCGLTYKMRRPLRVFKILFFLFNALVFVLGVAIMGMGLWYRIDPKVYEIHKYMETKNFTIAGWIMLFGGFAVIIMTMVGHVGVAGQRKGIIGFYALIMTVVTILFVACLVLVTVYGFGESLERFATKEVLEQIQQKPFSDRAAQFLDFLQVKMKCCGAISSNDYLRFGMNAPISCYANNRNYIISPGCGRAFRNLFDIRGGLAAGFCAAAILCQLATIIICVIMYCLIIHSGP